MVKRSNKKPSILSPKTVSANIFLVFIYFQDKFAIVQQATIQGYTMKAQCDEMTDTLGFAIVQTGRLLHKRITAAFANLTSEITFEQMGVLYFISRSKEKEMIQQDIAEVMDKTKSAILRSIDILEKKRFVKRLSVPGDRRKNVIELTESGKSIVREMHKHFLDQDVVLKKGLGKEDLNKCLSVLGRVQEKCK